MCGPETCVRAMESLYGEKYTPANSSDIVLSQNGLGVYLAPRRLQVLETLQAFSGLGVYGLEQKSLNPKPLKVSVLNPKPFFGLGLGL